MQPTVLQAPVSYGISERIPSTCNAVEQEILFVWIHDGRRNQLPNIYMKQVVGPVGTLVNDIRPTFNSIENFVESVIRPEWNLRLKSLGMYAAPHSMQHAWASEISADAIPYDGPTKLTDAEQNILHHATVHVDLHMDVAWATIEGLGWRPGCFAHLDEPPRADIERLRSWWNPLMRNPDEAVLGATAIALYNSRLKPLENIRRVDQFLISIGMQPF